MRLRSAVTLALSLLGLIVLLCLGVTNGSAQRQSSSNAANPAEACANDDSGLTLPPGFCATIFADQIGHARHMVVTPNGVLYVNTWSGGTMATTRPIQVVSSLRCKIRTARERLV